MHYFNLRRNKILWQTIKWQTQIITLANTGKELLPINVTKLCKVMMQFCITRHYD